MKKTLYAIAIFLTIFLIFSVTFFNIVTKANAEEEKRILIIDEKREDLTSTGKWESVKSGISFNNSFYLTSGDGATLNVNVSNSNKVDIVGYKAKGNVSLKIKLDGNTVATVAVENSNGLIESIALDESSHNISIEVIADSYANFYFDGFFVYLASIGEYSETVDCFNSGFDYTMFATGANMYYTGDKGAKIRYSFNSINIKSVQILAAQNIDSGNVRVIMNGNVIEEKLSLKANENLGKKVVYTIDSSYFNSNIYEENKMTIEYIEDEGQNQYLEFYGLVFNKYLSYETETDEKDYKYVEDSIEKEELFASSKNYSHIYFANNDFYKDATNSILYSNTKNATIEYMFVGCGIEVKVDKSTDCGKFLVEIDGEPIGKVNTYSNNEQKDVICFGAFELSTDFYHTIKITVLDEKSYYATDSLIKFKGVIVYKTDESINEDDIDIFSLSADEIVLKDNEELIFHSATSTNVKHNLATIDMYIDGEQLGVLFGNTKGGLLTFAFRGTGVVIYGERNVDKGKAKVFLDNQLMGEINEYSAVGETHIPLYVVTGLKKTSHEITIKIDGEKSRYSAGNYFLVSGFDVINEIGDVDNSAIIDDTNPNILRENFSFDYSNLYYNNSVLFSNLSNANIRLKFQGTSISIYGNASPDGGVGSLFIDDKYIGDFNTRSANYVRQQLLYTVENLEPDVNHTLKILVDNAKNPILSMSYVSIDFFRIEDYSDYVFEGYPTPPYEEEYVKPDLQIRKNTDVVYKTKENGRGCSNSISCNSVVIWGIILVGIAIIKNHKIKKINK